MTKPSQQFDEAMEKDPTRGAVISPCGKFRYVLWRSWEARAPVLTVCMLNPSTADAEKDDPTIRRLIGFAKRDGFGGIGVVNLYGLRASDPAELSKAEDAIGPDNDTHLMAAAFAAARTSAPLLCAWGAFPTLVAGPFLNMARSLGVDIRHLGLTKDGHPRHPLYVDARQPLERF